MNYDALRGILDDAFEQATGGKGQERHAAGRDFEEQPIIAIPTLLKDDEGISLIFQAIKKLEESLRLPPHMKRNERLGAINYIAASMLLPACQSDREEPVFRDHITSPRGASYASVRQPPQGPSAEASARAEFGDSHREVAALIENGVDIVDGDGIIPPGVNPDSADGGVRARVANLMPLWVWDILGGDREEWYVHRETRNLHTHED